MSAGCDVVSGLGGVVLAARDACTVKHAGSGSSRHAGLTVVQLRIQRPIYRRQFKVFLLLSGCSNTRRADQRFLVPGRPRRGFPLRPPLKLTCTALSSAVTA